jgi:hypothetical protein
VSVKRDKDFEEIYKNLSDILDSTLVRYTEAYKIFNVKFSKDWDKKTCSTKIAFNKILAEINAAIKLHKAIDTFPPEDCVDIVLQNYEESRKKIEIQVYLTKRWLKKLGASDILY